MENTGPSKEQIDSVISILSIGNFQEALEKTLILSQKYPDKSLLHNISGACYQGLEQFETAVEYYKKAIAINPSYYKAHYNLGGVLHNLGKLNTALESFEKAISIEPNYAEAHNNIGNLFKELGQFDNAIKSFRKAIEIKPNYLEAHYNIGRTFQDQDNMEAAISSYEEVLVIKPDFAELHNNLGVIFHGIGEINSALYHLKEAVRIKPEFAEAYNNLGNVFKELNQPDKAIDCYESAVAFNPSLADGYFNIALILQDQKKFNKALIQYKKTLTINPNYDSAQNNLGIIFEKLEQFDSAIKSFEMAIFINPNYAEAHHNLGNLLKTIGRPYDAIESYQRTLIINQDNAEVHNNLGIIFMQLGKLDASIDSYEKALTLNPTYEEAYNNLGVVLRMNSQFEKALESFEKALTIEPKYAEAYSNIGSLMKDLNQLDKAVLNYEYAFNLKPEIDFNFGNLFHTKMHLCIWDDFSKNLKKLIHKINHNEKIIDPFSMFSLIDDAHIRLKNSEIYAEEKFPKNNILAKINNYSKHTKIRIGYFSADFREHPVSDLTAELYELHDRNQFEVYAFSFGPDTQDKMNLRIKAGVDNFYDVQKMSHLDIAKLSRSLEIDIAIDLGGFTEGCRTEIFAMLAAPIQLSYLGYPGTMGTDYYDYLIADLIVIPEKNKKYYAEKIVYLPSLQANDSVESLPEITLNRKELGLPNNGFVFCCFNNTYKITPIIFDSWARILEQVEKSVLILLVDNESAKINLKKEIALRGVDPQRLIFGERLARPEYLARYQVADLFLDTSPCNAGATASDALRMGLPMLTLKGESYQARMGASILSAMNLSELITNTSKEYESVAIELATNPDRLKIIKDKLISNLSTAPLFNTPLFTKNLELAYTKIYERHQQGLKPDHIYF